ncbi:hybrid non-ribosomal peptide synthetase/type I polyketide synthase [Spirillospora albida]|uniref:hybrid non-ribosomal peptide synthetase/type I polyketide synthase n=1 Tax=Spirillospora albida TaxID=58123 RepID=UPI000689AD2E|nr:hybrid non-ribosomal peptide synthetase/type I polyketide synthase [Spirillospora albida]
MTGISTLTDALLGHRDPERGIAFIGDDNSLERVPYPELARHARSYLAFLQAQGARRGDELVIAFDSNRNVMIAYWAALLGGIIPVPMPGLKNDAEVRKVVGVWSVLGSPWLAFDDPGAVGRLGECPDGSASPEDVLGRGLLTEDCTVRLVEDEPALADVGPDDIAFIQFSSGSTGRPKGVTLTHRNLLCNIDGFVGVSAIDEDDVFLTWKPISHDFGMIGFHLAPLVAGCAQYWMTTKHFVWNPTDWMSAASRYGATILGTTNAGVQHLLTRYERGSAAGAAWDLSRVRIILNGAEMISARSCREFSDVLRDRGLREDAVKPTYGLAENTLIISQFQDDAPVRSIVVDRGHLDVGSTVRPVSADDPTAVEFVLCGTPHGHSEVRIVDDAGNALGEGRVGRIHVRGGCVTGGYYRNEETTREIIREDGWLDTQDLGFLHDGQLVIVGRSKEVVIVGGVNHYPADIEDAVLDELGRRNLNRYIACAVPNADTAADDLVVFAYFKGRKERFRSIEAAVKRAVMTRLGLKVAEVVPVRSVPKTTSGKVQRHRLVQDHLAQRERRAPERAAAGTAERIDRAAVVEKIVAVVDDHVRIGRDDHDTSLFDLGCSSVQLIGLQEEIQRRLGVELEQTFIIDHPTVNAMVAEVSRRAERGERERPAPSPARTRAHASEPIAVIGMAFRLPGGIGNRERFWSALSRRADVIEEIPADRWRHSPLDTGEVTTTEGGYLRDVDRFDPLFFNISPAEARLIDPQQRLLLELTWEAFEDAGIAPNTIGDKAKVGVFAGISLDDYLQVGKDLGHSPDAYTYTGNMANAAAGRISYVYGFRGPSAAIDTACSSSLYAVHQGCRELKQGGCDLAVAAGVNLILSPEAHVSFSRLGALSPSGRCRSFDDAADGYIRSEGAGVVVLKRLADAERDGDDVLAVITGSAVNHNGRSGGFTVPSGDAQSRVIEDAMAEAGLGIDDLSYLEAHGSGTPIGDPQEINALARVFAGRATRLRVGSVKSNLGHLEAAAGMAALCKVLVSLAHRRIPGTPHFRKGNRLVDWENVPIEVVAEEIPWEPAAGRRRAGVSSLGINGSNAHVIVEEYDRAAPDARPAPGLPRLLTVSANSAPALRTALRSLAEWSADARADLADVSHTLTERRAALRFREALVCDSPAAIPAAVERALASPGGPGRDAAPARAGIAFVFSGQGTQYPGMARELYDHADAFRHELDEIDREFRRAGDISPMEIMFGDDESAFRSPLRAQPMIFAVELALARYWRALGITPAAVIGHSIGEYAAACFAGAVGVERAVALVTHRARVMEDTPRTGSMATLLCSRDRVERLLRPFPDVSVAAVNAAENITVSGPAEALDRLAKDARGQRIFMERLDVSHAFHSAQMAEGAERLYERIRDQWFDAPEIPWISAMTGEVLTGESTIDAAYWSRHLVEPVLFRTAVAAALERDCRVFVEIGSMATVGGLIAQEFGDEVVVLPSLRKGRSDVRQMLESIGELWKLGGSLEWSRLPGSGGKLVREVPHTPFDRQRIWYGDRTFDEAEMTTEPVRPGEREAIGGFLRQALSQITGVSAESMDDSLQLFSLGLDSLMLAQLGQRAEKEFNVLIPIKVFFESLHTLGLVTDFILENRQADPVPAAGSATPGEAAPPALPVVPSPSSAAPASAPPSSGVEGIVATQLAVMQQQLSLLGGAPAPAPAPAARPARSPAPPTTRRVGAYTNNIVLTDARTTDRQARFMRDFVAKYTAKTRKSKEYADAHREKLADWIASLNFNPGIKETVYPIVSSRSRGATFWDLDGNEYVDTAMGYGVHFFGHQPDFVVDAVKAQLDLGYELGPQNKIAGEVAELVHRLTGAERVTFCNTGSEAVMVSLRLARASSGRDKVARFTGSYHGGYDGVLAEADGAGSIPMTVGIPQAMVDNTMVLTYDSADALDRIRRHGDELAAVLVEPVQSRNPSLQPREFLHELRRICTEHGIALIFDEMIVGFRVAVGGAQEHFGVEADIAAYGKLVGGGMPIGIVAGKAKYLDAVDGGAFSDLDDSKPATPTTFFGGTFCKHPLAMAACKAVLTHLRDSGAERLAEINRFTAEFARRANDYFEAEDVPLKVAHFASIYQYESLVPRDLADRSLALNLFFKLMAYHGVYVWERRGCFFSLAHTREHQDRILEAIRKSVEALREGGFDFRRATSAEPARETTPLSSQEKRIYVLSRMRGGNEAYQIICGLRFDGALDLEKIDGAFRAIARKHDRLRTRYEIDSTDVRARVVAEVAPERHVFDRTRNPDLSDDDVMAVMNRPFDLAAAPLWRYGIVIDRDGTHRLVISLHHIAADFTSLEIIYRDLARHLEKGALDEAGSDDYASFVRVQSEVVHRPVYEEHRRWWMREFATLPTPLSLPTDSPYPLVNDFSGSHHYFQIDEDVHRAARALIEEHKTTPSVFYLSLWAVLLAKVTGDDDLCIGIPMDQRMLGSFEHTVGMFAQSLPLRIRPAADLPVPDLLRRVRDTCLEAMEHSLYSYDVLVEELDLERDFGRNALFDVMFTFQNARGRVLRFGDLEAATENFAPPRSTVALSLDLTERDGGLFGDLSFSNVYGEERAAGLMDLFQGLIERVVKEPGRTVGDLSLLDDESRERLMTLGTGPVVPDVPSIAELIEEAFRQNATRPAIRFRGADLTYAALAERVDRYAAILQEQGAVKGDVIGLLLPPSPELITLMLAVNRVGCAWLPMDVKNPVKRLRYMIETAAPRKVVSSAEAAASLELGDRALSIREEDLGGGAPPAAVAARPDDLAYVIFTSGSTGDPKGVMVTNGSLANFLHGMPEALRWGPNKAVACLTTPSFDIHLLETLLTLVRGGTVVVAEEKDARTPADIADFVTRGGVEYMQMTPTRLRLLCTDPQAAARALKPLKKLIVGGEAFPENLLPELGSFPSLEIFNVYGPTETCIWSSVKELAGDAAVSIGRPIANTTFYVLDDNLELVPEGTSGNLWIGGHGVSPGYLNRPELTRELFRDDPFGKGRIYLSGDRALWKDGEVHCLGRIDNQVKVRGHRIELEEIELAIAGHDLAAGAAVVVQELPGGNQLLRGFYQVKDGAELTPDTLRARLAECLPDYMVPATLTEVADLPLTTSGKVDRKALEKAFPQPVGDDLGEGAAAAVDQRLIAAWKKILGDIPIGYDDSFFDIGGNSFSLILLLEELNRSFPDALDVSDLFANPTIGKLGRYLKARSAGREAGDPPADRGVRLPESWFVRDGTADGRVETTLPERTRATLEALRESAAHEIGDLLNAAFALTLGRVLGQDEITLCVVGGDDGVTPVRFDFAGKTDLTEILDDYRRQAGGSGGRPDVARFAAGRRAGGTVSVACRTGRGTDGARLLRHFDLVFGIEVAADGITIGIDHARDVDSAALAELLSGNVKLLGMLGIPERVG